MRQRVPRLGSYRVLGRLATGADGTVYRAYDENTMVEGLLVVSPEGDRGAADRVAVQLAGVDRDVLVETHPGAEQVWAVLAPSQADRAVTLVGLDGVPQQSWFAAAYGWPHPYPKTWSQVAFRSACFVVVLGLVAAPFFWFR